VEECRAPRRGAPVEEPLLTSSTQAVLEDLVARAAHEPGLAVSITRGPEVAARHCVGLASLEHGIPIDPGTRFHIVSVGKTFTAAAVLVLAARGVLTLDDPVRRHIPELRTEHAVTLRHLLSMTSGLRDVLEIERLRGVWRTAASRPRDLLDLAYRQTAASAPPGAQYMYANVNVVLLEEVIARASGMPAEEFRRAALYAPLGLSATGARPHDGLVVPDLAEPYAPDAKGRWARATHLLGIAADPLVTSLDDLTHWLLALRSGAIGGVDIRTAMAERSRLRDGRPVYYGLGLAVRRYRGLTVLCHTGSQPGYKAHLAYVPARDLGLAILSNREDTRPAALAAAIMDRVIGGDFPEPHPAEDAARRLGEAGFTSAQMDMIEGGYVDLETGEWLALEIENGVLHGETLGDAFFLYHEGHGVFRDGDDYRATVPVELRLDFDQGDVVCRLDLGGQAMTLRKNAHPIHAPEALAAFVGVYENQEIGSRHLIRVEGRDLMIDYGQGGDGELAFVMEPIADHAFLVRPTAPGIAYRHLFRFERDPAGLIVSAVVTMERLKNARLSRVAVPIR
jgi:CubicO group peptidase (beta-lactamase class C family)